MDKTKNNNSDNNNPNIDNTTMSENESYTNFIENIGKSTANHTPPTSTATTRILNPFEAALADRLHLPLIASPSLFEVTQTPQSNTFKWTIEEVSSLQPAHVEAHETQFHDSPDPEYEAKAQSAISSYFKDQIIVPSPVDCPLRRRRIFPELNGSTPTSNSLLTRNISTQTELSLPLELPAELNKMLCEYMLPSSPSYNDVSNKENENDEDECNNMLPYNFNSKDMSLRRKLFDKNNVIVLDNNATSPISSYCHTAIVGTLSDSSGCSLSPMSVVGQSSPAADASGVIDSLLNTTTPKLRKYKRKAPDFAKDLNNVEDLSPIFLSSPTSKLSNFNKKHSKRSKSNSYEADVSYSNLSNFEQMDSTDASITCEVSRLRLINKDATAQQEITEEIEEDIMQTSSNVSSFKSTSPNNTQTNGHNSSSSRSDTPKSSMRSTIHAARKNLSHSFTEHEAEMFDLNSDQDDDINII